MVNRNTKYSRTYFGCYSSRHKNLLVLLLLIHHVSGALGLSICVSLLVIDIQCQLLFLIESATLFRCGTASSLRRINGVEIATCLRSRSRSFLWRKWHLICVYILDI